MMRALKLIIFCLICFAHTCFFLANVSLLLLFTWKKRPAVVGTLDPRHLCGCYKEGWCVTKRTWHGLQTLMQIGKFLILSSQFVLANANDNTRATRKAGVSPSELDTNCKLEPVNLSSFLPNCPFHLFHTWKLMSRVIHQPEWRQVSHQMNLTPPAYFLSQSIRPFSYWLASFLLWALSRQFVLFTFSNVETDVWSHPALWNVDSMCNGYCFAS